MFTDLAIREVIIMMLGPQVLVELTTDLFGICYRIYFSQIFSISFQLFQKMHIQQKKNLKPINAFTTCNIKGVSLYI